MTTQAPQSLDYDQFQAAVKAARDRFSQLRQKHPTLNANQRHTDHPMKNTGIAFILDRSGSMQAMTNAAISGFNEFLKEKK